MLHIGFFVKSITHTVSAEITNHAEAVLVGMFGNRVSQVADKAIGMTGFDADLQTFFRHIHQLLLLRGRLANDEHSRSVGIIAVEDRRHIHVDDVAFFQDFILVGNTVTHHLVHTRTHTLGKTFIVERSRNATMLHGEGMNHLVDVFR